MSRTRTARKTTAAVIYGGGGLGALGVFGAAALAGLMFGEMKIAERRIPIATTSPPASNDTVWTADGVSRNRPPIRIALLGDSTAAGYGVHRDRDTPAAQLAIGISEAARRPVHVCNAAVVGAQSYDLPGQLDTLAAARPELAVIMVGANDVTERTRPAEPVRHLATTVRRLRSQGAEVVVGTCPDLGTIQPLPQPLRWYARRLSRRMAVAQTVAVVRAGGRTVSLGDLLGPLFATRRDLFADDLFHPSAAGYAEAAGAILPSCLDALGLRTRARSASTFTTRRVKPVAKAAAQAAARPGSEVAGTVHGAAIGRGPFAQLRRRLQRTGAVASPETATSVRTATVR